MNITLNMNVGGVFVIFILCWCIKNIMDTIIYSITLTRNIKQLKDIPDNQREMIIKHVFKKDGE